MSLLESLKITPRNEGEIPPENIEVMAQDPAPNEKAPRGRPRKQAAPVARATASTSTVKLAKEVTEDLTTMLEMTALMWGVSDECCAPVLEAQARPIAAALVAILSRNPRMLARFAQADIVSYALNGAALGRALAPLGKAFYRNHISKAHEDHDGLGEVPSGGIDLGQFAPVNGIRRN